MFIATIWPSGQDTGNYCRFSGDKYHWDPPRGGQGLVHVAISGSSLFQFISLSTGKCGVERGGRSGITAGRGIRFKEGFIFG